MSVSEKHSAVRVDVPSPAVGEGFTAGRCKLGWVWGTLSADPMGRQPLTRRDAHCVRVAPPSPTREEGQTAAIQTCRTT
jgi:hypothetical protein